MLQFFAAQLSERLDRDTFVNSWELDARLNAYPEVDFGFLPDGRVAIRVRLSSAPAWRVDKFRQAFAIAVHRVAPQCEITWL